MRLEGEHERNFGKSTLWKNGIVLQAYVRVGFVIGPSGGCLNICSLSRVYLEVKLILVGTGYRRGDGRSAA